MGQAASSIKQNDIVEESSQSVALAEMGIEYFENLIRDIYESSHEDVIKEVQKRREADLKDTGYQDDQDYIDMAKDLMEGFINENLSIIETPREEIDFNPNASFTYTWRINPDELSNDNVLKIEFSSTGIENEKETSISAALYIDFSNWMSRDEGDEDDPNEPVGKITTGTLVSEPENLTTCQPNEETFNGQKCQIIGDAEFKNDLKLENSTFKVTEDLTVKNMNKDIVNSTVYIRGTMIADNMNNLSNVNLHVGRDGEFKNFNGGGLTDSIIEIVGKGTFGNMKLIDSNIYVGNGAEIGQINGITNSNIFIDSYALFQQGINIDANSTICVNGELTIKGNINNNSPGTSKIYALSTNPTNLAGVITIPEKFNQACGRNTGGEPPISWGETEISTEYDYNYQYTQ